MPAVATKLDELIASVRDVVRQNGDAGSTGAAVARVLREYLSEPELLSPDQLASDASGYRQHILHVEPDGSFSIVALVWLPGQATPIHDHVSWCVVGVYRGDEHETTYQLREAELDWLNQSSPSGGATVAPHLVVTGEHVNRNGSIASLVPPGDIHCVRNGGNELAVSLHIYGADIRKLGCSIRRRYDQDVR